MTYRIDMSDPFEYNVFGIITGAVVAQLPDIFCQLVRFRARSTNIGSFFLGNSAANCNWEIDAGDDTDWVSADNLNNFFVVNGSGTSDYLAYWIQR